MAAEQRFTDPQRTSPAANTPGRLVSSGSGSLRSGQLPPGPLAKSPPVSRYPAELVNSPIPAAPSARGVPPMQMNNASDGNGAVPVLSPERTMTARSRSSACRPTTSVRTRTSTFGQNKGNGLNAAGGLWHEITTAGTAAAGSSSAGGGGY